ncbi:MAG: glycosyltransferase family 2 protein [Flavobacteriales bacterium]|nr:glycosyltransferase family 2 protein [Flavobacteriales bacterium]
MSGAPLISIIMPARNAAGLIAEAITSVLGQTWHNWELLVVDNNSEDGTSQVVRSFSDERITLIHEPRRGVGHARNAALIRMRGDLYCFLDADDRLPPTSLADRAELILADPKVHFADGPLVMFKPPGTPVRTIRPTFRGAPLPELLTLSGRCFLGPTWMIRRAPGAVPLFRTDMTHAEDLFYYMSIAHQGLYDHVDRPVLHYRVGHVSAMSDLDGLHQGYRQLIQGMRTLQPPPEEATIARAWDRIRSIMWRSYAKRGRFLATWKAYFEPAPDASAPEKISA